MSQSFYIRTESPNPSSSDRNPQINSCTPNTVSQYFTIDGTLIKFVKAVAGTPTVGKAEFNFNYSASANAMAISTMVGSTKYYLNINKNQISLFTGGNGSEYQWQIQQNSGTNGVSNVTSIPSSGGTYYIKNISPAPLQQVVYVLNYTKNQFGNFDNNSMPMPDTMSGNSNPRTTDGGNIPCVYTFYFVPVTSDQVTTMNYIKNPNHEKTIIYDVIASNISKDIGDLKMMITYPNTNHIEIKAQRNKCENSASRFYCVPKSDILFSCHGRISSRVEEDFNNSYRVIVTKNNGIFPKSKHDPKISFYEFNENYVVLKSLDTFYLLNKSLYPSYKEMEKMVNKFNHFIQRNK